MGGNAMNQTIEISTETAALIESQAKLAGLSVDDYLKTLVPNGNGNGVKQPFYETATAEEWVEAFSSWVEGHKSDAPALAIEDISRETIY